MNTAMDRKVREEFERDMLGCWVGWCIGKGIIKEG